MRLLDLQSLQCKEKDWTTLGVEAELFLADLLSAAAGSELLADGFLKVHRQTPFDGTAYRSPAEISSDYSLQWEKKWGEEPEDV
jgi:hypothetical protein